MSDTSYIEANERELRRLRALVESADEATLRRHVTDEWTVADELGHLAFWDARSIWLAEKLERGEPFTPSQEEPEDVDWINDSAQRLIAAIPPMATARLALQLAEEVDAHIAALPADQMWPANPDSLLNAYRAEHRQEHLDAIAAALDREPQGAPES